MSEVRQLLQASDQSAIAAGTSYNSGPIVARGHRGYVVQNLTPQFMVLQDNQGNPIDLIPGYTRVSGTLEVDTVNLRLVGMPGYPTTPTTYASSTYGLFLSLVKRGQPPVMQPLAATDLSVSSGQVSITGSSTTLPMEIASGNLPPLTSSLPVLVATIPYTAISTSALEEHYAGVLARNGRIVTVMLVSTLNEALNVAQFQTYDGEINTLIGLSGAFPGAFIDFPNNAEGLNTGATAYWATSKENTTPQYLGVGWPDLGVAISCATDPASGNVYVLVWNEL